MRILSIINQKGGCGKTTTAINLSACLALSGKKTLLVDLDPQAHATLGLNGSAKKTEMDLRSAMLKISEEHVEISRLKVPIQDHLDIIPATLSLAALEQELSAAVHKESRLRDLLRQGRQSYEYILIDAPPNLGMLTINALTASSEVLIPVETSMFSLHGLRRLFQVIDLVQERTHIDHRIHILLTIYAPGTRLSREILSELQEHFKDRLLKTRIRQNVHLKEAASYGLPVARYQKNSHGSWDYTALAEEIVAIEGQMNTFCEKELKDRKPEAEIIEAHEVPRIRQDVVFMMEAPQARSVYVVGEFNRWQVGPTAVLEKDERGVWKRKVQLPPGSYQYKFYVDGEWLVDPRNPFQIVTENGVVNSMVKVK